MNDEHAAAIAKVVLDGFVVLTDRLTTEALAVTADLPRKADGSIADPYWRGVADGIEVVSQGLMQGMTDAAGQFGATP